MAPKFWVSNTARKIEKVQIKFNKRYACLHQNTANYFVLCECGRYHLAVICMTQYVEYWIMLTLWSNYRFPKQCYNTLRSLASAGKTNQISVYFCIISNVLGDADTFGNASICTDLFRQSLTDCFTQQWHSEVGESPKALNYKLFRTNIRS